MMGNGCKCGCVLPSAKSHGEGKKGFLYQESQKEVTCPLVVSVRSAPVERKRGCVGRVLLLCNFDRLESECADTKGEGREKIASYSWCADLRICRRGILV
jgi:hypothetical protein